MCSGYLPNDVGNDQRLKLLPLPFPIYPIPHPRRAPKRHHRPSIKRQILSVGRVSSLPWSFLPCRKLSKSADQNIVPGLQGLLDQLENLFNQGFRFMLGEPALVVERLNQVVFYEGHGWPPGGVWSELIYHDHWWKQGGCSEAFRSGKEKGDGPEKSTALPQSFTD